jgi:hypothetical protein
MLNLLPIMLLVVKPFLEFIMKKNLLIILLISLIGIRAQNEKIENIDLELKKISNGLSLEKTFEQNSKEKNVLVDPNLAFKETNSLSLPAVDKPLAPAQNDNKTIDLIKKVVEEKSKTEILPNNKPELVAASKPESKLAANVSTKEVELKPLTKITTTKVVKELNLVAPTKSNWWKWLGLLALLGALLGFLAATLKKRKDEKDLLETPKKNRHSEREVQFTFDEEKEDKGSEKRNHNKDFK